LSENSLSTSGQSVPRLYCVTRTCDICQCSRRGKAIRAHFASVSLGDDEFRLDRTQTRLQRCKLNEMSLLEPTPMSSRPIDASHTATTRCRHRITASETEATGD